MLRPRTSTRDTGSTIASLAVWLQAELNEPVSLRVLGGPSGAGFSSETVLFDIVEGPHRGPYVLRMPPPADSFPLFPSYDLSRQSSAMRLVHERTTVPVPRVPWIESDPSPLGAPFFVMDRIDGVAASDVPLYVLEGWLLDASADDRVRAEAGVVRAIAGIHDLEAPAPELARFELDESGSSPLQRHVGHQRRYYDWLRGEQRFALIESTFAWLDTHWPERDGRSSLSWGDARVANILFREGEPVAVLDWESVAVGPRELDVAWLIFFHAYFQGIAESMGHTGLPEFLRRDNVVAAYTDITGYEPQDLDWYLAYAALRQALVSIRVSTRAVHFGEREQPDDPQDLIMVRSHLEGLLER
jgi:aminoglycoside phosphotransferase (APT) family kinase protein